MASNYNVSSIDLDSKLEMLSDFPEITERVSNTGYNVNGTDISQRYVPLSFGSAGPVTGYDKNGVDISTLFAAKGTVTVASWKKSNLGDVSDIITVRGIAMHENRVFLTIKPDGSDYIYRSDDYGETFQKVAVNFSGAEMMGAQISHTTPNVYLCCGNFGRIYRSPDYGLSWNQRPSSNSTFNSTLTQQYNNKSFIYSDDAHLSGRFLTSNDFGNAWSWKSVIGAIPSSKSASGYPMTKSDPTNAVVIVAGHQERSYDPHLVRTTDEGATWERTDIPGTIDGYVHLYGSAMSSDGVALAVGREGVNNVNTALIARSVDYGKTWTKMPLPVNIGTNVTCVAFDTLNPNKAVMCNYNKVWMSDDAGITWVRQTIPSAANLYSVAYYDGRAVISAGNTTTPQVLYYG